MYYFLLMNLKLRHLPRPVWGWAFYDFANSAFATTVMSVVFSVYFAKVLVPPEGAHLFGTRVPAESLWGYMVSMVMVLVILLAPGLGAIADHRSNKRSFLMLFTIVGALANIGLYGATPPRLWYGFALIFMALLGYELALVFYNAFLTDITTDESAGRVSGFGFALGYIGGGTCLAINMAMLAKPIWFGIDSADPTLPARTSVGLAGFWWLLFSIPTFLWVHDIVRIVPAAQHSAVQVIGGALRQLVATWQSLSEKRDLKRFLLSYLIFNDGIQTILLMASIFGAKELNMSAAELALCYLVIQFVAFVGAMVFGRLADAWSHKKVILTTLLVYTVMIVWAIGMKRSWEFWTMGVIIGIVLGGSQAAARSLFAVMIPPERSTELFALYAVVGKAAALIGPAVFGLVAQFAGLRMGIASLLVFFVVGGAILFTVNESYNRAS